MAFVEKLMFQPIAFQLYTTDTDQRNVSAPWLIQNVPTISEAPQAGSLNCGRNSPQFWAGTVGNCKAVAQERLHRHHCHANTQ